MLTLKEFAFFPMSRKLILFFNNQHNYMGGLIRGANTILKKSSPCKTPGPGCSKVTLLVNISLNFQKIISQVSQYFLLKKNREASAVQKFLIFLQQKISVYLITK